MGKDEQTITVSIRSLEDTEKLGVLIGNNLEAGDILLLSGDLGAGKTTLTQSIARGLDVPGDSYVSSPSFALVHEYPGRYPLYHMDCYRLSGEDDVESAGLLEYLETKTGVCVVEWANRLGRLTPQTHWHIQMDLNMDATRQICFHWNHIQWSERMEKLYTALKDMRNT